MLDPLKKKIKKNKKNRTPIKFFFFFMALIFFYLQRNGNTNRIGQEIQCFPYAEFKKIYLYENYQYNYFLFFSSIFPGDSGKAAIAYKWAIDDKNTTVQKKYI